MASKKSSKSVSGLTGSAGGASGSKPNLFSFPKESQSPDHKTGKAGRVTASKQNAAMKAQSEARKGGTSPARETQKRAGVSASGKKGK